MNRDDLIEALIDLRPVLEGYGVRHLALFGSRARKDNKPTSDVDLLVDVAPNVTGLLPRLVERVSNTVESELELRAHVFIRHNASALMLRMSADEEVKIF